MNLEDIKALPARVDALQGAVESLFTAFNETKADLRKIVNLFPKYVEYKTVCARDGVALFDSEICSMLANGWELHGNQYSHTAEGITLQYQPMVKRA